MSDTGLIRQRLPEHIAKRIRLPVISAPMLRVSGPDLVTAACASGVIGAFPTANARSIEELDTWLTRLDDAAIRAGHANAPYCPNLIIRQPRLAADLACLLRHRVEMVITSVGSPAAVVAPLHDAGCMVLADVATLRHAEKALEAGVDGLVLLTAGAGGQTGWLNPFAFVRAVREWFDGLIVLAGGMSDGHAVFAAQMLGCDLAYMGTKFIATRESMAADVYKAMLVSSTADDIVLTRAFTGLPTNMLRPSIVAAGLDPEHLDEKVNVPDASELYGGGSARGGPKRWTDVWSAGHSVTGVHAIETVNQVVEVTLEQYTKARDAARH